MLSGTEAELAINVYDENVATLRAVAAQMKQTLEEMKEVSDVRANREVTVRSLRIDYDEDLLLEAGLTLREAGEQVAAAFNGLEVGEVREGLRRRAVTVRLAGDERALDAGAVKALVLAGRDGRYVRLDEVARVVPEDTSNLMLREGGRRKALISCNAAAGIDIGRLVARLREKLTPIAAAAGCSVAFGGSHQARESAGRRLWTLGLGLAAAIFILLFMALKSPRAVFLTLVNVPLGGTGGIFAVAIADPVLSVSSLVGFITVVGFVVRNGLLLVTRYRERLAEGADWTTALREGSLERMPPIIMTSLTTIFGLVPIILSGDKPGGELLAPLAVVQFGGLLGATALNLLVLPAAAKVMGAGPTPAAAQRGALVALALLGITLSGCRAYTHRPIDWEVETTGRATNAVHLASLDDAAKLALIANPELNRLRLKAAGGTRAAEAAGWWEDPEIDLDLMRIIQHDAHPFLGGASLAFTLPLSGVPGCEARAAKLYAEADLDAIRAAERETTAAARKAAIRLSSLRACVARLRDYDADPRLRQALADGLPATITDGRGTIRLGVGNDHGIVPVYVVFEKIPTAARPGERAQMTCVTDDSEKPVVAVPTAGIVQIGLTPTVFVRDEHDPARFLAFPVTPGPAQGGWTAVGGLPDDDDLEIVTDGAYELKLALPSSANKPTGHFHADGTFHDGEDEK